MLQERPALPVLQHHHWLVHGRDQAVSTLARVSCKQRHQPAMQLHRACLSTNFTMPCCDSNWQASYHASHKLPAQQPALLQRALQNNRQLQVTALQHASLQLAQQDSLRTSQQDSLRTSQQPELLHHTLHGDAHLRG